MIHFIYFPFFPVNIYFHHPERLCVYNWQVNENDSNENEMIEDEIFIAEDLVFRLQIIEDSATSQTAAECT